MRTKLYPQGEGAVNSLEGMHPGYVGGNLTGSLRTFWNMLDQDGWVRNWNGDVAPVVHQVDRLMTPPIPHPPLPLPLSLPSLPCYNA